MTTKIVYLTKCDKCGKIRIKGFLNEKLITVKIKGKDYCLDCLKKGEGD